MDYLLDPVRQRQANLITRLGAALTVGSKTRSGEEETVVSLDHRLPDPAWDRGNARWRLATARHRLARFDGGSAALEQWHRASPHKGRRLIADDLGNGNRAAAILSWHFEPGGGTHRRPHLITSIGLRMDVPPDLRMQHLVAGWLLLCVALAIDQRTVSRGRIGVVLDKAIALSQDELRAFGFQRGPRSSGYRGAYYELPAKRR
ncbi:MAG TPA: hypothetical protein VFQ14_01400 [Thermoleophilaceae bacterium]|nr:hypothetical protein [Thermoleophilaceae bacterium]